MKTEQFKKSKHEPFFIVKQKNKYQIAVGNNIVSRKRFDTIKQAEMYIAAKPYELIINTTLCMFYEIEKNKDKVNEYQEANKVAE